MGATNDSIANTVNRVRDLLETKIVPEFQQAKSDITRLKSAKEFSLARRLAGRVRGGAEYVSLSSDDRCWLRQQHALCTYKDSDMANEPALRQALEILDSEPGVESLATTTNQETLGIAGAVHKRLWGVDGVLKHLRTAADYYLRGWRQGLGDDGYTGINAAFTLDLLADELGDGQVGDRAASLRGDAGEIRRTVLTHFEQKLEASGGRWTEPDDWWSAVTAAEAAFGRREYARAHTWLDRAKSLPDPGDWQWEALIGQLAALARMHERTQPKAGPATDEPTARDVLARFVKDRAPGALSLLVGKVGLALSGGGYRASLFHIGVLARLAELDLLRHVEVLSCVSGGSIVGAAYYLRLRRMLKSTRDEDISSSHYVAIIKDLIADFDAFTARDSRTPAFLNAPLLLRSPTRIMASILEEKLFRPITDDQQPMLLRDLKIEPAGHHAASFHPRRDNWSRNNKVPILIVNATTVNTAHNWQFTATWMGEPPASIEPAIDANERLRRMYHHEAPKPHDELSLGLAVAASAAVPIIFPAMSLKGLYPDRVVRLVDGGVYDNQGVFGLIEQDCTLTVVSDASGHLEANSNPAGWLPSIPFRLNGMFMDAARRDGYRLMDRLRRTSPQRTSIFIHMKSGMKGNAITWLTGAEKEGENASTAVREAERIPEDIQRGLAALRTDLDNFSRNEAHSLMLAGYCLTKEACSKESTMPWLPEPMMEDWPFLAMAERMTPGTKEHAALLEDLELGQFGRLRRNARRVLRRCTAWCRAVLGSGAVAQ